ncbi:MAG: HlyC/CorC family transporter [Lachnospiraceae bacterium]|nr:HlyC/CorC family transporter [Lachnospiraceae bacterium]
MDDGSRLPWIIAIILLFLAAFFAVAETALAAASKNKIKVALDRGDYRAKNAMYCIDHFEDAISTLLVCTNIVHISTAALVTVAVTRLWGLSAVSVSTLLTTIVVFFAGEMLPKSIAKKYSEKLLLATAGLLRFFMGVFGPVARLLTSIGKLFVKDDAEVSVTEDELYDIIEDMAEEGSIDEDQSELISSAIQFGDVTVDSILTPRVDMVAIDVAANSKSVLELVKGTTHSRLPVYEGTIDNIIGVLHIRKFMKAYLKSKRVPKIRPLLESVYFTPQITWIDTLLPILSGKKQNMAVVTDSFGGTLGIVTVEDILEELVGEIWDEDDIVEEAFMSLGNNVYLVDAEETVGDLFDEMDYEDPEEDERFTNLLVSDWVYEHFPEIPRVGDCFEYNGLKVTVSLMDHNRIVRVRVVAPDKTEEGGEEE